MCFKYTDQHIFTFTLVNTECIKQNIVQSKSQQYIKQCKVCYYMFRLQVTIIRLTFSTWT